ncbi:hypothetical protein STSO111631_15470 [Stackebrandtia soli]
MITLVAALAVGGAAACQPKAEPASSEKTTNVDDSKTEPGDETMSDGLPEFTTVTITKSGGIAGITETVTIDADGAWSYVKARMAPQDGTLEGERLSQLRSLVADPELTTKGEPSTDQCADMFVYAVTAETADGKTVETATDDCGIAPNETMGHLLDLVIEATPM